MDLAGIWETLNDKSWDLLDLLQNYKIPLGDYFEKYNIPAIFFPIALIVIILLLILALSGGGPQVDPCGDLFCDVSAGENLENCPTDCTPGSDDEDKSRVIIRLDKDPDCQLDFNLYDSGGSLLRKIIGTNREVSFEGVDSKAIYLTIEGPYGKSQRTSTTTVEGEETPIDIVLDNEICEKVGPANGVLRLTLKDASTLTTLAGVTISIVETKDGQVVNTVFQNTIVNNLQDFTLPHSKTYTIYAQKEGYNPAEGTVTVSADRAVAKTLSLIPKSSTEPDAGELEICVRSGVTPITEGVVTVQSVSGDFILPGDLSSVDPNTEPTGNGCYVFQDVPTGGLVTATTTSVPSGCIPQSTGNIEITGGERKIVYIDLECQPGNVSFLRVKLIGKSREVLTENSTITLWTEDGDLIPGTGIANSLAMGSVGYTEEVVVPAGEPIYVWARGLPLGYLDYQSDEITLTEGEHRSLDLTLNYSAPDDSEPSEEFTFSGVAAPNYVSPNQTFGVSINEVIFGDTKLNGASGDVRVTYGDEVYRMVYDGTWKVNITAPSDIGEYDLLIQGKYQGKSGSYSTGVEVRVYGVGSGLLLVTPIFLTYGDPPLDLFYDITFNGSTVTQLATQEIEVTFLDSPGAYAGEISELTYIEELGYWMLTADVPFKGEYELDLYLEVFNKSKFYNNSYTLGFTSSAHSDKLRADVFISETSLSIIEGFDVEITLTFDGKIVSDLEIMEIFMDKMFYTVPWKNAIKMYALPLTTPSKEVCNLKLEFLINNEKIAEPEIIHVIDISRMKAVTCPMDRESTCNSIEDVRRCVYNAQEKLGSYGDTALEVCIISGCSLTRSPECLSTNKGDLEPDCVLNSVDLNLAKDYINTITSQAARNELIPCLDMDNDMDVDEEDVICLNHLVSGKWEGDVDATPINNGTCAGTLNGGFCFNIDLDSPLPGDTVFTGNIDDDDQNVMNKIISSVSDGVTPTEDILAVVDFNQDGTVNSKDLACLKYFFTVDFETGEVIPSGMAMDASCMNIFGMGCEGLRGDLNKDGDIEVIDLIILKFIVEDILSISNQTEPCADVDDNGMVNDYDVVCLEAYFTDQELWLTCMDCDKNLPEDAFSTIEICNDGWDNDCDGLTDDEDSRCACSSATPCDMKWDADGGTSIGVDDGNYKRCAHLGEGYVWLTEDEISAGCDIASEWNTTMHCNGILHTCVFNFTEGFGKGNTDNPAGNFAWMEGIGNIGPVASESYCGYESEEPSPPTGWVKITDHTGHECGSAWAQTWGWDYRRRQVYFRWNYDFCESTDEEVHCTDGSIDVSGEPCPSALECWGPYTG